MTLDLSTYADSSSNTKMDRNGQKINVICHVSHVPCQLSCVMCCMSHVTCHLSLTPTASDTDPPPANSPILQSKLVCKDPKTHFFLQNAKDSENRQKTEISRGMPILAICSSTSPPGSQWANSVKITKPKI